MITHGRSLGLIALAFPVGLATGALFGYNHGFFVGMLTWMGSTSAVTLGLAILLAEHE